MRRHASFENLTPYQSSLVEALAEHLLELRNDAGKTQGQIAKAVGISRVHYGNMENKKVAVGWTSYLALVLYFCETPTTREKIHKYKLYPEGLSGVLDV